MKARSAGLTPLEYMLLVMNDQEADPIRRDRMAIAAAPYTHPRLEPVSAGKKEKAAAEAKTAGQGSSWGDDLVAPHIQPIHQAEVVPFN